MPKNIIDKIWDAHVVSREEGAPDIFFIDLQLLHEVTSPQAFTALRKREKKVFDPKRNVATVDHSIPTDEKRENFADELNRKQIEKLRKNCTEFGITLYDIDSGHQGIVHVTGPELGLTQPGMTIVCGDSHTSTHGAFGAIAFGIGTTQISHVLETSCLLLEKPKTMKIIFEGMPSQYFTAKDAILALIRQIGVQGGTGCILEYTGEYIQNLSMEERMTICNMSIECGARAGLVSPDENTFAFLKKTPAFDAHFEEKKKEWSIWASDKNAEYDAEVIVNIQDMLPLVTWGTTPAQSSTVNSIIPKAEDLPEDQKQLAKKSLEYTQLHFGQKITDIPIDYVFIGSCTNGRINDLRDAAKMLKGKKIHKDVTMFVVPGSEQVEAQAKKEGLDTIFIQAGAEFRRPGCSACLAMNGDTIPAGKHCASTSNRNFIGRQGSGAITHLMSPQMAALSALHAKVVNLSEI